jgi:hypothetical protein
VTVTLYVEGGGRSDLNTRCREGFSRFLSRAGLIDRMPRVVACGGRRQAYDRFCTAFRVASAGDMPILLVDSEAPVLEKDAWSHVKQRAGDDWSCPQGATADHLHFMAETMEAWFYADKDTLSRYYGQGFRLNALSNRTNVEQIPKADLFKGLANATRNTQKREYAKGDHSFQILGQ